MNQIQRLLIVCYPATLRFWRGKNLCFRKNGLVAVGFFLGVHGGA